MYFIMSHIAQQMKEEKVSSTIVELGIQGWYFICNEIFL